MVISGGVKVGPKCFIGVNATLRDHITIGESSIIGAGALILRNVRPHSLYRTTGTELSPIPSDKVPL